MRLILALMLTLFASDATSGAWMREEGAGFAAFTYSYDRDLNNLAAGTTGLGTWYGEYGLSNRVTVGATAWASQTDASAFAFLRLPLTRRSSQRQIAFELGVGGYRAQGQAVEAAAKYGLSFGRGINTRWGPGWMQINASKEHRFRSKTNILKSDLTFGVSPNARTKLILEVHAEKASNARSQVKVSPSYVRRISKRTHLTLGVSYGVRATDSLGVKLGTWLEF